MRSKGRLIALLTDFGTGDPYVAAMKGVILSIHPGARIVDISHEIPRHEIVPAAFTLLSVEPYYPAHTIFLVVVDPGVGTGRRIICLEKGKRLFIAPDNGLLNLVSEGAPSERWYSLKPPAKGGRVSRTFHGRDLFAPTAARLAGGTPLQKLSVRIPALPARRLFVNPPSKSHGPVGGTVIHIDHFGNIVTNIRMPQVKTSALTLTVAGRRIKRFCRTYEDGPARLPFILQGSTGLLEISVRRGHAARTLGVQPGDGVVLRF